MLVDKNYKSELIKIKDKLNKCLTAFQNGKLIMVGDDGQRENEADLVFHAIGANQQNVNFAITHAKGLLCVSLSHELADNLGFSTSPQFPGGMSHTNFTLSVDAKHGITSGISAKDRAHTISIMAQPNASLHDFISPGHVFPLRAMNGGLLARAGHTEALYELCRMSHLPHAAAMCEVLGDNGEALNPALLESDKNHFPAFKNIPFISTVDILWNKVLFEKSTEASFEKNEGFLNSINRERPHTVFILNAGLEKNITLPTAITIYNKNFSPETIRISITNSTSIWDNLVSQATCCIEISMFSFGNCLEKIPTTVDQYCNMSAKEGLNGTKTSIRRALSQLRSIQFLQECFELNYSIENYVSKINFIVDSDKEFLKEVFLLSNTHLQ